MLWITDELWLDQTVGSAGEPLEKRLQAKCPPYQIRYGRAFNWSAESQGCFSLG
jgi:hypothetical protein